MGSERRPHPVQLKVKIESESTDEEKLEDMTRKLANELRETDGVEDINFVPGSEVPQGARAGEIVNLGEIVLTFISSGAMVAAITAINSWIRGRTDHKIKIEIQTKHGSKAIDGSGLTAEEVDKLIDLANGRSS